MALFGLGGTIASLHAELHSDGVVPSIEASALVRSLPGLEEIAFVAAFTKKNSSIQVRPGLILLALIVGAGLGAFFALHAPLFAPIVPLGALGFLVAGAWAFFHRPFR